MRESMLHDNGEFTNQAPTVRTDQKISVVSIPTRRITL